MAHSDDFQALGNISSEITNSQVKILISSQCIKAQAFLLNRLKKQSERQKEVCKFINSSNFKLETEIKFAEQEIKSLNTAIETIKLGNIELNKEYFLSKEKKTEIFERTKIGTNKYENLWSTSKKKYESIPIVQKLIEVKNKNQAVQANINAFTNESKHLVNQIRTKKNDLDATDTARILELAEFFVRERTKMLIKINENSVKIEQLLNEVKVLEKPQEKNYSNMSDDQPSSSDGKQPDEITINDSKLGDNWSNLNNNTEKDTLVLPKLHLQNNDLNILSIKLDQINKVDLEKTTLKKEMSPILSGLEENTCKINKREGTDNEKYISCYFDIPLEKKADIDDEKLYSINYSEKKLIHILEDIKLDKTEAFKIIKKLEVNQFQATNYITSKNIQKNEQNPNPLNEVMNKTKPAQKNKPMETGEIEEIKLPLTREEEVVDPPSQFLDASRSSQEKKTVSFNIPIDIEMPTLLEEVGNSKEIDIKSPKKRLNNSTASEESYTTIKDKILKKRNLDLSPQFVYSKSNLIHKQHEDKTTSKFFESENRADLCMTEIDCNRIIKQDQIKKDDENKYNFYKDEICVADENNVVVSSPKGEIKNLEVPIVGFLFNHGPQGIPESLNLSMSTTGFEDSEDFPRIDSNVLLSPKADISATVPSSDNNEVLSQDVPNFLAGFRKTGLTIFGSTTSSDIKPDFSAQSQSGGFNFDFGNEEKKGRGGFFSMFH